MTTGIYQLIFSPYETYIGQARSIEDRYLQHCDNLSHNRAAVKMQQAYRGYNPQIEVLLECHEDYLNAMEMYYINVKQPKLNTVIPKFRPNEEMRLLADNKDMLKFPPANLISTLIEQTELVDTLEGEQEKLQRKCEQATQDLNNKLLRLRVANEMYDELETAKRDLTALVIANNSKQDTLNKLRSRNLWQRIFNSQV